MVYMDMYEKIDCLKSALESSHENTLVKDTSTSLVKDYSENLSSSAKWLWKTVIENFSENFIRWQKL